MQEKATLGSTDAGRERQTRALHSPHPFAIRSEPRGAIRLGYPCIPRAGCTFSTAPLAASLDGGCRCGFQIPLPELERDPAPFEVARLGDRRAQYQTHQCLRANPGPCDPLFRPDFICGPPVHEATDPIIESSRAYQNSAARYDRHGQPFSRVLCDQDHATGLRQPFDGRAILSAPREVSSRGAAN